MSRVCLPARSADDWRPLLARPDRHWVPGRSAHALAHAWQAATAGAPGGMPPEVRAVLAGHPDLANAQVLAVFPEHATPLPGGTRPSQTDALVLARAADGLAVVGVEGKAGEPFGPTIDQWQAGRTPADRAGEGARPGRQERLAFLMATLGLDSLPGDVRYQLLHRTAAAVIEADRFAARHAIVLVHAFDPPGPDGQQAGFGDFAAFVALFGGVARPGGLASVDRPAGAGGPRWLHFGWATGAASA